MIADCCGSYSPEFHDVGLRMIAAQGGDPDAPLPQAKERLDVVAQLEGALSARLAGLPRALVDQPAAVVKHRLALVEAHQLALVPLSANRFCEMMSELTVAWLLLEGALVGEEKKKGVAALMMIALAACASAPSADTEASAAAAPYRYIHTGTGSV